MPARTAFSDVLRWTSADDASPAADSFGPVRARPADPATMLVTIQVTLPALRAGDGSQLPGDPLAVFDPLSAANQLAGRLHEMAAQSVHAVTPDAGVSTTVALVVDRPGAQLSAGPLTGPGVTEPIAPAQRRPLYPRQQETAQPAPVQAAGPPEPALRILTDRREAVLHGTPVVLTRREYELLLFLVTRPGRVFTRQELLTWVWGHDVDSGERTVDVHVRRLRTKLLAGGPVITTVRGVGYRLDEADEAGVS